MSAGVYRAAALSLRGPWWTLITPKMFCHTKPPKNEVGAFETFAAFTILSFGVLSPAAWILSNVPEQPKH